MPFTLNIDGGSRGNPGPAACGVVICENKTVVYEAGFFLGRTTNNVAEYQGLIHGVKAAIDMGVTELTIYSDSELMVRQITGEYRVKSPDLKPLFDQAQSLLLKLDTWKFSHIYRESNGRADAVANKAMDEKRDVILTGTAPPPSTTTPAAPPPATKSKSLMQASTTPEKTSPTPPRRDPQAALWSATFATAPESTCPAGCLKGERFEFSHATPQGLCIYAAIPILSTILSEGPDTAGDVEQPMCLRCGAEIKLTRRK